MRVIRGCFPSRGLLAVRGSGLMRSPSCGSGCCGAWPGLTARSRRPPRMPPRRQLRRLGWPLRPSLRLGRPTTDIVLILDVQLSCSLGQITPKLGVGTPGSECLGRQVAHSFLHHEVHCASTPATVVPLSSSDVRSALEWPPAGIPYRPSPPAVSLLPPRCSCRVSAERVHGAAQHASCTTQPCRQCPGHKASGGPAALCEHRRVAQDRCRCVSPRKSTQRSCSDLIEPLLPCRHLPGVPCTLPGAAESRSPARIGHSPGSPPAPARARSALLPGHTECCAPPSLLIPPCCSPGCWPGARVWHPRRNPPPAGAAARAPRLEQGARHA